MVYAASTVLSDTDPSPSLLLSGGTNTTFFSGVMSSSSLIMTPDSAAAYRSGSNALSWVTTTDVLG
jgi:hypothetical protein